MAGPLTKHLRDALTAQTLAIGFALNSPEHARILSCLIHLAFGDGWADGWTDIDNIALNARVSRVQVRSAMRALSKRGIVRFEIESPQVFYFKFPVIAVHKRYQIGNWHLIDIDSESNPGISNAERVCHAHKAN